MSLLISRLRSRAAEKEKLLEQETSRKNDLITYLAHDLKTPLASVIGYLCLLTENPDLPESLKEKYTESLWTRLTVWSSSSTNFLKSPATVSTPLWSILKKFI